MKSCVNVGLIGLGRRGFSLLEYCLTKMRDVCVTAVCDTDAEALDRARAFYLKTGAQTPLFVSDYRQILQEPAVDCVVIATSWNMHSQIAVDSMRAGKYTAVEVGCAYDLSECWELLAAYKATGAPLMMLENCCYGRFELMALRMAKEGKFGEIVHCSGGYMHYLPRNELFANGEGRLDTKHYRLLEYAHRNCEQYPTHEFGPIAKILGINRGNRIMTLASFASKSRGIADYMDSHPELDEHPLRHYAFRQGDIIDTILTCENGETVLLELDTTIPRPFYSRGCTIRGTKGFAMEHSGLFNRNANDRVGWVYLEGMKEGKAPSLSEYMAAHDHPIYEECEANSLEDSHSGIDWLVLRAFIEAVKAGTQTPIDVYDTLTMMAIAPLSAASIARGGAPVDFPDFTQGRYLRREPPLATKYSLDLIVKDPDTPIVP
ncbi:MAG: Gfo/Idh/MocA family oxidoreductase [Clostridia bacterium]|nr:Gfo/Idh/MocA family oxidoreductase [Clostridia bacterium]